jgi:hypothetical protein
VQREPSQAVFGFDAEARSRKSLGHEFRTKSITDRFRKVRCLAIADTAEHKMPKVRLFRILAMSVLERST